MKLCKVVLNCVNVISGATGGYFIRATSEHRIFLKSSAYLEAVYMYSLKYSREGHLIGHFSI